MSHYQDSINNGFEQAYNGKFHFVKIYHHSKFEIFNIENTTARKIRESGPVGNSGSDRWVIDEGCQCWISQYAQGEAIFEPISAKDLIAKIRDREFRIKIRETIGMKPEPPLWLVTAIKYNFTSTTYDITQYDLDNI